jgi:hypothetical protein
MRVPMRSTGADYLVLVMKHCNGGGAKGVSEVTYWSTSDGRNLRVMQNP